MVTVRIPCLHLEEGVRLTGTVPDFHSLTREEIAELMDIAYGDTGEIGNAIYDLYVRLIQGIPGMTCPRPDTGPVAEKMRKVEKLFLAALTKNVTRGEGLIGDLDTLINR